MIEFDACQIKYQVDFFNRTPVIDFVIYIIINVLLDIVHNYFVDFTCNIVL